MLFIDRFFKKSLSNPFHKTHVTNEIPGVKKKLIFLFPVMTLGASQQLKQANFCMM